MHLQSVTYFLNSAKEELDKGNMPGAEMLLKQAKPLLENLPPKHSAWLAYYVADAPSLFSNKPEPERK